jgi:diguanylate cyclase (GGDEF)-like protein
VIAALDALMHKAGQGGTRVSVLFLDLDRFKSLNDRFGHAAGDRALREFAAVVRTALRAEDVFGRWGGEEFVALLPGTDRLPARAIAQRICDSVATHTFRTVGGTNVTCSIGVATYPLDARDLGSLVEAADTAMYAAKQRGRNRVIVAGAPDSSTWEEQSGPATPPGLTG